MKKWLLLPGLLLGGLRAETPLLQEGFTQGLGQWVVEQQPGGTVTTDGGRLVIADKGGCTVWLRQPLAAPVRIAYTARVTSGGRVSDLNCFWMATDPARPDDLFAAGHRRDGKFASYDSLRTYYVGYGGNTNSTTRFRRYDGAGNRPLLPEHDRSTPEFLLKADHDYRIEVSVSADGRVRFVRDGVAVFDWQDPEPLRRGWFGFRTVDSRIEISDFQVHGAWAPAATAGR